MAQFYGLLRSGVGESARCGHKESGLVVKCNGWRSGVTVEARHQDGRDKFYVYLTNGSSPAEKKELVALVDGVKVFYPEEQE